MKMFSGSKILTIDVGQLHKDLADSILNNPTANYWVLKQVTQKRPKWYVVPAIRFSSEDIKILDEDEKKKRLRHYLRELVDKLPESQTVAYTSGKIKAPKRRPAEKSGYVLALKNMKPVRIVLPEKTELHPIQIKAEVNLAKLSRTLFEIPALESQPGALTQQSEAGMAEECALGIPSTIDLSSEFNLPDILLEDQPDTVASGDEPTPPAGPPASAAPEPAPLALAEAAWVPESVDSPEGVPPAPPAPGPPDGTEPPKGRRVRQTAALQQAYPWIIPDSEHVVQNKSFDVVVELRLAVQGGTLGAIPLSTSDKTFTLDVHLLFEGQSKWDTLEFNWVTQTAKQARFSALKAPKYCGKDGATDFRTIRVNFYLEKRWAGEGLKNIEILPRTGAEEAEQITKPEEPVWRKYLNVVSTEVAPPDLLVRIQRIDSENYYWSFFSPHADLNNQEPDKCKLFLNGGVEQYVKTNFQSLANVPLTDLTFTRLQGTCKDIYDNTPPAFKDVYWQLFKAALLDSRISLNSIQFVSDEPYVPWEIMLVDDQRRGPGTEPEILSVRHAVGRWIADESCQIRANISAQQMAIFASDYKNVPQISTKLDWAEQEAQGLEKLYKNKPKAVRYKLQQAEVLHFLKHGKAQVVHFSCHGKMDQQAPSHSALLLEDDFTNFMPAVVKSPDIQRGIGAQHPLVFLNACQVGGAGVTLSFVTGWPQAFLAMGASAVIAPLWSIGDQCARDIAMNFYRYVISNSPVSIGAALQHIRNEFKKNRQMTYLAYLLYGDPTAIISVD